MNHRTKTTVVCCNPVFRRDSSRMDHRTAFHVRVGLAQARPNHVISHVIERVISLVLEFQFDRKGLVITGIMDHASHSGTATLSTLVTLPVEVLVYIISFLSTRDKVIIRCVSKSLRSVSEVPSLWERFIWTHYSPHDDKLLKHILKMFGKHIKILHFAGKVAPSKLEVMLKFCKNVIQLSLPSICFRNFTKLDYNLEKLGKECE